jgi:hypothetical protein
MKSVSRPGCFEERTLGKRRMLMRNKKQTRKTTNKRNAKTQRKTPRKLLKTWHPSNYLLESHPELGIPEYELDFSGYASPL